MPSYLSDNYFFECCLSQAIAFNIEIITYVHVKIIIMYENNYYYLPPYKST